MTTEIRETHRYFFAANDLFDLVSDVRRYPDFITQITALRVVSDQSTEALRDFVAQVRVRYKMVAETFSTRVQADPQAQSIDVSFVAGPFRTLENQWVFHALSDGSTLVDFRIRAEFRNGFLQMLLDTNRDRAARVLMGKFMDEAQRRYGSAGNASLDLAEEIHALSQ